MAHPDFEEFIGAFNEHRVRYLVIGAHAVAFHARPRATNDLDVYVDPTSANSERVLRALTAFFGGTPPGYSVRQLLDPSAVIQLGVAPVRIDILSSVSGIRRFADAWAARVDARFGKTPAHYLSLADLVSAKRAAGRPQDIADLVVLEKAARRVARAPRRR